MFFIGTGLLQSLVGAVISAIRRRSRVILLWAVALLTVACHGGRGSHQMNVAFVPTFLYLWQVEPGQKRRVG